MKKGMFVLTLIIFLLISGGVVYLLKTHEIYIPEDSNSQSQSIEKPQDNEPDVKEDGKLSHNKLMIVAHPDDDTIFGGAHLVNDDYTVVCVTCGSVDYRLEEFINVMAKSEDKYMYLSHTDLTKSYNISNWDNGEKEIISSELDEIIKSRNWDLIVTHNPEGEYGHKHHKMLNKIVTDLVKDKNKLYYFGRYYSKETINDMPVLGDATYAKKEELLALYESQPACSEKSSFRYMFRHETWVQYSDWV